MSFSASATRQLTAGDTPDLNDGVKSYPMGVFNIARGNPCYIDSADGFVKQSATFSDYKNQARFVPVESKDNSGGSGGDLEIKGVLAPQLIALKVTTALVFPGEFVRPAAIGSVEKADAANDVIYARAIGSEGALFDRDGSTPFGETLTPGVVPEQSIAINGIGWFQLVENGVRLA